MHIKETLEEGIKIQREIFSSPKHFKKKNRERSNQMDSVPVDQTFNVEQQLDDVDHRMERNHWVLNSPEPPAPWQELLCCIRNTVFPPQQNKGSRKRVCSFLEGLFPILKWGRNYKASKFKNDLMAGLTLASLSIPQVHTLFNIYYK